MGRGMFSGNERLGVVDFGMNLIEFISSARADHVFVYMFGFEPT